MNVSRIHTLALAAISLVLAASFPARGDLIVFNDKAGFLSATGAAEVADFGDTATGIRGLLLNVGNLKFTSASGNFEVKNWTGRLDRKELGVWSKEEFDADVSLGEVHSFGFELVEPQFDPYVASTFVDSTFEVSLWSGGTLVASTTFSPPNDQAAFLGLWTSAAEGFNKVKIRETTGGKENEFFGDFYAGTAAHAPLPGAVLLGVLGLGAARMKLRRFV